jgi:hypothetical protein
MYINQQEISRGSILISRLDLERGLVGDLDGAAPVRTIAW